MGPSAALGESGWRAAYEQARRAWPTIQLGWPEFRARVQACEGGDIGAEHAPDAYLAWACAEGNPQAILTLEQTYLKAARPAVGRIDARAEFVDEVIQDLRTKLLVQPDPRIARYEGRGPLLTWIRVAASRTAIDVLRASGTVAAFEPMEDEALDQADLGPEARLLRETYRQAFQEVLAAAFSALEAADRNMLRRHFVDRMTLEEMATPFGVHPATIARKLTALREQLADEVKTELGRRYPELTAAGGLESFARAVRSQVYVSLTPLLSRRE